MCFIDLVKKNILNAEEVKNPKVMQPQSTWKQGQYGLKQKSPCYVSNNKEM